MKSTLILLAVVWLLAPAPAEAQGLRARREARRPAITVNGVDIPRSEFERRFSRSREEAGVDVSDEVELRQLREEVIDTIIRQELLYQNSVAEGVDIDAATVDAELESIRSQFETEEEYLGALTEAGTDEEQLRSDIGRSLAIQELLRQEVFPSVSVDETEQRSFYDENSDLFQQGARVAARHILISTQELGSDEERQAALQRAEGLRRQLIAGADFDQLAREHSEGPSSVRGGVLGEFGRGQMVGPFEEAAFALDVDEISAVVETIFGYHIIQVTERFEASVSPFEEIQADVHRYLLRQKLDSAVEDYTQEIQDSADVVIHLERG